jgi:methylthioxylose transferase
MTKPGRYSPDAMAGKHRTLPHPRAVPAPPYRTTAAVLLATLVVSQVVPWAERAFGSNVPPLFAKLHPAVGPWLPLALVAGVLSWLVIRRAADAGTLVFLATAVLAGWATAVTVAAQAHGVADVTAPFRRPLDYWANVPLVQALGPRTFAVRFAQLLPQLSLHARTHPPGGVLFLWALSKAMGGSVTAASLIVSLVGALGAIPTYWLARAVYDERAARAASALFALSPGVLLFSATSMDAVFMTVVACALAALARAPGSGRWSLAAGALWAVALCFTFASLSLALVALGVGALAVHAEWGVRGHVRRFAGRGAFVLIGFGVGVLAVWLLMGLDLLAAFRANLSAHLHDPSRARPYVYWLFADVPAFLIAFGLAQSALLVSQTRACWRARRFGLESVVWATLAVLAVSGLFRGEVDHIWLFLVPLAVAPAGAALAARDRAASLRTTLAGPLAGSLAQATVTQLLLRTYW